MAEVALALGLPLFQPDSVNGEQARARIAEARPEALCVCAFGALIKEPLLSERLMLNVHPSLLPRWRGAAPIERAIEAGDEVTGVSIMRLVLELDAGPVCLQSTEPILPDDDFGTLSARLESAAGELLERALDEGPPFVDQPTEGITYAHKVGPEDRRLDPRLSAEALARRVRALTPHIGAYADVDGERLGVRRAAARRPSGAPPDPGHLGVEGTRLWLGCEGGALELLEVQPAGGRPMDAAAYLRGHAARLGPARAA